MMKRGIVVVLLGSALAGASPQQKDCVAWAKSWEDAKYEAKERNVPIFYTIQQDNNGASTSMQATFRGAAFITQSKRVVCVIAHGDIEHGTKDVMVNKQKVPMCRAYDGITCDVHKGCQVPISQFFPKGQFDVPTQIWCKPDGTELFRFTGPDGQGQQDIGALVKDMERALDRVSGPKISRKEWEEVNRMREEALEASSREDFKVALGLFKKLSEHKIDRYAKEGAQQYEALIRHGVKLVERAVKNYEQDPKKSKATLIKLAKEFKGTEAGTKADQALKELNK